MRKKSIYEGLIYLIITSFSVLCIIPLLLVIIVSFSSESSIKKFGYSLFPHGLSLSAYQMIFSSGASLANSYMISVTITVVGTLLAVTITAMAAFTLSNRQVRYRNKLALYFFFTMIFNGGIVPWYIVCSKLGLHNNIFALIIPSLVFSPFNMFLVRNFMKGIPDSLMESAKIDGAGDIVIAFRIYFPLCIPVLAAVGLFYGLAYWNDWWNSIMLVESTNLFPLQYLLFKMQSELQMLRDLKIYSANSGIEQPTESFKMATVIITIGPIVFLYPFLQKYFVKGLIIGSVKG